MAQPVTRGDWLRFSVPVFSAMIDQDAGVGFLGQNVFYAGIRPEELPISGFVHPPGVMTDLLRPKLRGRFAVQRIEPAGNFLLPPMMFHSLISRSLTSFHHGSSAIQVGL